MTAEIKMRTLAAANATLAPLFFTPTARWFGPTLQPGYITQGSCVRIKRLDTDFLYAMDGCLDLNQPRFQLDCCDLDAETARQRALKVRKWLGTIDLVSDSQFASPPTTPLQFPTTILDERQGEIYMTNNTVYLEILDFRIYCSEPHA